MTPDSIELLGLLSATRANPWVMSELLFFRRGCNCCSDVLLGRGVGHAAISPRGRGLSSRPAGIPCIGTCPSNNIGPATQYSNPVISGTAQGELPPPLPVGTVLGHSSIVAAAGWRGRSPDAEPFCTDQRVTPSDILLVQAIRGN